MEIYSVRAAFAIGDVVAAAPVVLKELDLVEGGNGGGLSAGEITGIILPVAAVVLTLACCDNGISFFLLASLLAAFLGLVLVAASFAGGWVACRRHMACKPRHGCLILCE